MWRTARAHHSPEGEITIDPYAAFLTIAYPLLALAGAVLDAWCLLRGRHARVALVALLTKLLPLVYIMWSFRRSDAPLELLFTMPFALFFMVSIDLLLIALLSRDYARKVTEAEGALALPNNDASPDREP